MCRSRIGPNASMRRSARRHPRVRCGCRTDVDPRPMDPTHGGLAPFFGAVCRSQLSCDVVPFRRRWHCVGGRSALYPGQDGNVEGRGPGMPIGVCRLDAPREPPPRCRPLVGGILVYPRIVVGPVVAGSREMVTDFGSPHGPEVDPPRGPPFVPDVVALRARRCGDRWSRAPLASSASWWGPAETIHRCLRGEGCRYHEGCSPRVFSAALRPDGHPACRSHFRVHPC